MSSTIRTSADRTTTRRPVRVAALAAALALTACSAEAITERALEEAVERGSDGQVDIDRDSGQITVQDDEGNTASFGMGTDVPADFADAVALPGGLEVVNVTEIEEDGSRGIAVTGRVESGSQADLVSRLDADLTGDGWTPAEGAEVGLYDGVEEMDARFLERGVEGLMVTVISDDVAAGPHQLSVMWFPEANA